MPVRYVSRRQILIGASGFGLGLPVLRSLLPRKVEAAPTPVERRFIAFASDHGGIDEVAMFPADGILTETMNLYSGHDVSRGDLVRTEQGDRASISEVLSAPATLLTPSLVNRMNVIRGMDIPWYIAHHTWGHLGNYAWNQGEVDPYLNPSNQPVPSIDQVMAWSDNFYGSLAGITERSLVFGAHGMSFNYSNPSERTGEIQQITGDDDPLTMFNRVFVPEEDPNEPAPRQAIVDRVFSSYQSLKQSDRRMSSEDKQRLDDHMDRLSELERRLNVNVVRRASCGSSPAPEGDPLNARDYHHMVNDVIAAAFLCGTSRIAVVKIYEKNFSDYAGDWHQDIAHQHTLPDPQAILREVNQQAFEHAVLDLAYKLDVEEAPDRNLLDGCLIQWSQESGRKTHDAISSPLVTFGTAGGNINTGNYCDYVKHTSEGEIKVYGDVIGHSGLWYGQWLAHVLQAMGVQPSEFADIHGSSDFAGSTGYGYPFKAPDFIAPYSDGVFENANDPLPFLS